MSTAPIVGILGGMGPLATADLYRKIIEATPASCDQDHLHVMIDADPSVPDRTEALLRGGEDPTPWLLRGAARLAAAGAAFIVMPCNTAHAFLPRVAPAIPAPFISMIDEAARAAAGLVDEGRAVGILATEGTISAGLYQAALSRLGLRAITPDDRAQQRVNQAIAAVKAGRVDLETAALVIASAEHLIERDAGTIIAACTELPLVLSPADVAVPLIDATMTLAQAVVREGLARRAVPVRD